MALSPAKMKSELARTSPPKKIPAGRPVDWSGGDEQQTAVRAHHVSGGMFKSAEESHHHPDSKVRLDALRR